MSPVQRDEALWTSRFWQTCSDEIFHTEAFALAFAKYLGRDGDSGFTEQRRALFVAPDTCKRAIRYSKVFLSPDTARWRELHHIGWNERDFEQALPFDPGSTGSAFCHS